MAVPFLTSSRTVLLITDEALYVFQAGKVTRLLGQIPWGEESFVQKVAALISKHGEDKSVVILNDMVEQHYRKERVPKTGISLLDRSSYIQRKLMAAFPAYPIRAAYPLKEKASATKNSKGKKVASDIYLFAAVPASETFGEIVKAVKNSLAPVTGFFLLPVESADMVKTLAAKLRKAEKVRTERSQTEWSVLIGQHRNGGLRQIVTKNGEIALTRMTPVALDDGNAEHWSAEVRQEFYATMSYLSRFGYDARDNLNVMIIANPHAHEALHRKIETDGQLSVLGASEAADILRLPIRAQDDERFADILHVAWIARKQSFVLPMKAKELERIAVPRKVAVAATFLLLAGACFMIYEGFSYFSAISQAQEEALRLNKTRVGLEEEYENEVSRKAALGYNVTLVQNSLEVKEELEQQEIEPVELFRNIGQALAGDLRLEEIEIERIRQPFEEREETGRGQNRNAPDPKPLFRARLKMLFPSSTNIDAGNQEVRSFRQRLRDLMPENEVDVIKFLKDYEFTEEVVVETGNFDARNLAQDYVAEILIRGRYE